MRLQNNILILFYVFIFFIYLNIDSVELKTSVDTKSSRNSEQNSNNGLGDRNIKNNRINKKIQRYIKNKSGSDKGLNILNIESDIRKDDVLNNEEKSKEETNSIEGKGLLNGGIIEGEVNSEEKSNEEETSNEEEVEAYTPEGWVETEEETEAEAEVEAETEAAEETETEAAEETETEAAEETVTEAAEETETEAAEETVTEAAEETETEAVEETETEAVEETETEAAEETETEDEEKSETEVQNKEKYEKENVVPQNAHKINYAKPGSKTNNGVFWNRFDIFSIFKKPLVQEDNYFRRELQNDYAFKNGLYFTATSVDSYNKLVDRSRYATIPLPAKTMVFVVTANKFFFQDMVYSNNKYVAVKKKFSYLMNSIINNLKSKFFFKNYHYQYLYKSDYFASDVSRKLLDFALLGDLSKATQTIFVDNKKISMHKLYGGWFHFLGIFVVNGYVYNAIDNVGKVNVVPPHLIKEFKEIVNRNDKYTNGYSLGLWRDFPNQKYSDWRFSVELFLWDLLNILPNELPHPATFVLSYNKHVASVTNELRASPEISNTLKKEDMLNWHKTIRDYISGIKGLDVELVSVDDYYKALGEVNYSHYLTKDYKHIMTRNGYIFLILLNKDFFSDELLRDPINYENNKKHQFFETVKSIIDNIEDVLEKIKDVIDKWDDDVKKNVKFYNYLLEETNYNKFNPHVLGEIAGITKHLKCKNEKEGTCTKDVSMHYKYGGWFEFGGAIHIQNINKIELVYEKHDNIDDKTGRSILSRANCAICRDAGLWRDIPGKDMSPYRYPLKAFIYEFPQFDVKGINLQNIHPFVLLSLIRKGLESEQKIALYGVNDNKKTEFNNEENAIENESTTEENNLDNIVDEYIENEQSQDKVTSVDSDENVQNNTENEQGDDIYNEENEIVNEDANLVENGEKEEEDAFVFGNSEDENELFKTYEDIDKLDGLNENENELYKKEDEDFDYENELEENGSDEIIKKNEILLGDISKNIEDSKKYNKNENGTEDSLDKMKHIYDTYENKNDLNTLTDNGDSNGINRKVLIFMIGCIITVCIALFVTLGIRLYKKIVNKKLLDKNKVLAFKDKEEIPVIQGIPAPWLNT